LPRRGPTSAQLHRRPVVRDPEAGDEELQVNFTLRVWRQEDPASEGRFERFEVADIDPDASFLEMLDVLNERLIHDGDRVIAFDSDCREGICGACSLTIDGIPHGPKQVTS